MSRVRVTRGEIAAIVLDLWRMKRTAAYSPEPRALGCLLGFFMPTPFLLSMGAGAIDTVLSVVVPCLPHILADKAAGHSIRTVGSIGQLRGPQE